MTADLTRRYAPRVAELVDEILRDCRASSVSIEVKIETQPARPTPKGTK